MIEQKDKVGTPATDSAPTAADTGKTPVPGVIYPRCPHCPTDAAPGADGSKPGDPQKLWRLRYDFPDGVVAEVIFCGDCRATISATIVGFTPAAKKG